MTAPSLQRPWRCDATGNPVGTDARMIGASPCDCQGCRAASALDAARARIVELEAVIICERESGVCVMVHDPEREPCTVENCRVLAARAARALLEPPHG